MTPRNNQITQIAGWIATAESGNVSRRQIDLVLSAIEAQGWVIDTHIVRGHPQPAVDPLMFSDSANEHHDGVSPLTMIGRPATHGRGELHINRTIKDGPASEGTA